MGYTTVDTTAGGQNVRVLVPDTYSGAPAPWCLYHHGAGESQTGITADSLKTGIVTRLTDDGWIVASSNAGGDNWGNDASLTAYLALQTYIEANYTVSALAFFSQSMGGLSGLRAAASGSYPKLRAWFGIYPACDVLSVYDANAGFQAAILSAWGAANRAALVTALSGKNPTGLTGSAFAGLSMRFYCSNQDTVVTKAANSDVMLPVVAGGGARAEPLAVCSGAHGDASHFQPADVAAFLGRAINRGSPTPARVSFPFAAAGVL